MSVDMQFLYLGVSIYLLIGMVGAIIIGLIALTENDMSVINVIVRKTICIVAWPLYLIYVWRKAQ